MRLDILMVQRNLIKSRNVAADLIKQGLVKVNNEIITKPAKGVKECDIIEITEQPKYVGRGGLKLEMALKEFDINPQGQIVLDVGASTGGFTDCLLQNGAKRVYAVDVGTEQLDQKLKNDKRVISLEKTDIRNIERLTEKPDLAVIDVSFISLELILNKVASLLKPESKIIALIKPQFETGKEDKNRSGVVKNDQLREEVLEKMKNFAKQNKFIIIKTIESPILGGSGNKEYLMLFLSGA